MTVVRTFYRQLSVFVTVPKVNEALRCVRGLLQREPDHSQVEAEDFVKVKQAVPVHIAELQHRWRQVLVIEVVCYLTLKTKNLKSVVKRILKAFGAIYRWVCTPVHFYGYVYHLLFPTLNRGLFKNSFETNTQGILGNCVRFTTTTD